MESSPKGDLSSRVLPTCGQFDDEEVGEGAEPMEGVVEAIVLSLDSFQPNPKDRPVDPGGAALPSFTQSTYR